MLIKNNPALADLALLLGLFGLVLAVCVVEPFLAVYLLAVLLRGLLALLALTVVFWLGGAILRHF